MQMIEGHYAMDPPPGVPVWDVDPYAEAILADPNDFYAELRAKGPFVYIPKYAVLACGRYDETREVFSDYTRFVSSRGVGMADLKVVDGHRPPSIILEVDPPDHTQTRRVLSKVLSPKVMRENTEFFARVARDQVAAVVQKGQIEAVAELAEVYPTTVFPQIVGLKRISGEGLLAYGAMVFDSVGPDNAVRRHAIQRAADFVPIIMDQCQRKNLSNEGLGQDIYAFADAGDITADQAVLLVRSLLSAGVDTTVTGIGNLLYCLAKNPDQFKLLKNNPNLKRAAFEEVLRYTSPVHSFYRTAGQDTEIAGVKIRQGTKILCCLGSANRDEAKFPDAHRFDITREVQGHMGMGAGIHGCVGQNLARAEVAAVLGELLEQADTIVLDGAPVWRPGNSIRALERLPIRIS